MTNPTFSKNESTTIVVIDDDHQILELIQILLSRRGYTIVTTDSPITGLQLIQKHRPKLVLLDYMMPEMDGLTALNEIQTRFAETAVVVFTGKGSEAVAVSMMKAGAKEYITKPFNNQNLVERIENVLKICAIEGDNRALIQEKLQLLEQIEGWNCELQERVREKTDALQKAQQEITKSEKLATLGYLSAGMAHEIRNPLNSIGLFVQLMRQGEEDPEQLEYMDKILKEVDRIDSIIKNLQNAARRTRSIKNQVSIKEVIESALDIFAPQIEACNISVKFNCLDKIPGMNGDPVELEQIFTNLFLNALDEMSSGGTLILELSTADGRIIVTVTDTGGGIPPDILPNVFEPFISTKSRGTGMGLPVVRRIVHIYQGTIEIEESNTNGTRFRLEFPASDNQD